MQRSGMNGLRSPPVIAVPTLGRYTWVRPTMRTAWLLHLVLRNFQIKRFQQPPGGKTQGRPFISGPAVKLVLLFTSFFAAALARQRFLHSLLLAWLEVEGVSFHFLNNVLLLYFALEAAQGVF